MAAYYNENDVFAAAWLRNLIAGGHIAPGEVDERSIEQVCAEDLRGFTQHHFFAGIGVWSHALKAAGWPDVHPVWTGSCPCQGFSSSGKRAGFGDKRHLWPAWFRLIRELRPDTIFGEQVASRDGLAWFDVVSADLEGEGYAVGAADTCAAGFGAPHIRQRLYFVAHTQRGTWMRTERWSNEGINARRSSTVSGVADAEHHGGRPDEPGREEEERAADERLGEVGGVADDPCQRRNWAEGSPKSSRGCLVENGGGLGDPSSTRLSLGQRSEDGPGAIPQEGTTTATAGSANRNGRLGYAQGHGWGERRPESMRLQWRPDAAQPGCTNGFWADTEWLSCRDGKARPVEPKYVKVVDGPSAALGHVCGGNSENETESDKLDAATEINRDGEGSLRTLRETELQVACSSQGREPREQCGFKPSDFVRLLPSSYALSQLHGDTATTEALLALLKACGAERLLQYTPDQAEAAWFTFSKEVQDSFWLGIAAGGFVRSVEHPLAHGVANRVGLLRGYGNALVAPQAEAFVRAYMGLSQGQDWAGACGG